MSMIKLTRELSRIRAESQKVFGLDSNLQLSEHEKQAMLSTDPCGITRAVSMESNILVIE